MITRSHESAGMYNRIAVVAASYKVSYNIHMWFCCVLLVIDNNCLIAKWLVLYNSFIRPSSLQSCLGASEVTLNSMGLLPDTQNCGLRMRWEYRERFPRHRIRGKPLVSDHGMHHGTCVTHVPWCMSGSLTRGLRGKRSRHSRPLRNPQFYVFGKRPMHKIVRSTTIHTKAPTVCIYPWVYLLIF